MASSNSNNNTNCIAWEIVEAQDYDDTPEINEDTIEAFYDFVCLDLSDNNVSSTRSEDGYDSFIESEDSLQYTQEPAFVETDKSSVGSNNQTSQPLSEENNSDQGCGDYQFISKEVLSVQEFQRQLPLQSMTENTINNTVWCDILNNNNVESDTNGIKLKIWTKDWIESCYKSLQTENLPVFPIIADHGLIEWIKIIYIESSDVYVGIQYGHQKEELSSFVSYLANDITSDLPKDLMILTMQFCTKLKVKSICFDAERVYKLYNDHKAVELKKTVSKTDKLDDEYKKKWVNNIEICDISDIVNESNVDAKTIEKCFNENNINYLSVGDYTRRDFTHLLKRYGIKFSVGCKIWQRLFVEG